jgi:hypothetical protein
MVSRIRLNIKSIKIIGRYMDGRMRLGQEKKIAGRGGGEVIG